MTDPRDVGPSEELTTGERRAFAALSREAAPPSDLEERTVALLRRAGHLPTPITVSRRQEARSPRRWMVGIGVAAAAMIFASGIAVGQYVGTRSALNIFNLRNASEVEDRVSRSGDRYVAALASLSSLPDSTDAPARARAREAALRILGAAAEQISHIAPDDPLAAAVLRGLNERGRTRTPEAPSRSVVWY